MSEEKIILEREYVIPFRKIFNVPRKKRARVAVKYLKSFISRHMKTDAVHISNMVNAKIWQRSITRPPRKIKVIARKVELSEEGITVAMVFLPEELKESNE